MNKKQAEAVKFANSMRGQLIIGQALYIALREMKKRPDIKREYSNESDMQYLIDNLYPMYASIASEVAKAEKKHLFGQIAKDMAIRLENRVRGGN
jgi:hypothetical protein